VLVKKGKGSPYSITERRVSELISVLGSQPAGDVSHKPGGRLPLLVLVSHKIFSARQFCARSPAAPGGNCPHPPLPSALPPLVTPLGGGAVVGDIFESMLCRRRRSITSLPTPPTFRGNVVSSVRARRAAGPHAAHALLPAACGLAVHAGVIEFTSDSNSWRPAVRTPSVGRSVGGRRETKGCRGSQLS